MRCRRRSGVLSMPIDGFEAERQELKERITSLESERDAAIAKRDEYRADFRKSFNGSWTVGDRRIALLLACLGPFALFSAVVTFPYGDHDARYRKNQEPAKW